jgi:predicted CoA-binding protein
MAPPVDPTASEWQRLRGILAAGKTIAVVGLSDRPDRPAHSVPAYLQQQGYRIIPVNPRLREALGETAYPSLLEVPEPVDVVQIFRRSEDVPPVVEDAIHIGAKVVWMQSGILHDQAAERARQAGLQVVMNTCMRTTHQAMRLRCEL